MSDNNSTDPEEYTESSLEAFTQENEPDQPSPEITQQETVESKSRPNRNTEMLAIDPEKITPAEALEAAIDFSAGNPEQFDVRYGPARKFLAKKAIQKTERTAVQYDSQLSIYVDFLAEYYDSTQDDDYIGTPKIATQQDIYAYLWFLTTQYNRVESTLDTHLSSIKGLHKFMQQFDSVPTPKTTAAEISMIDPSEIAQEEYNFEREALKRSEIKKMYDACSRPRNKLLTRVLYQTGIRNDDAKMLDMSNIDYEEKYIEIIDSKGGNDYKVPITEELSLRIHTFCQTHRGKNPDADNTDALFVSDHGGRLSNSWISKIIREIADEAGVQEVIGTVETTPRQPDEFGEERNIYRVTPHTLRHSIVTHLGDNEVPDELKRVLLGNSVEVEAYDHSENTTAFDLLRSQIA